MKNKGYLSFSSEVAETLGIECAIILNLFKDNKLDDISSYDGFLNSIKENLSFIDEETIKKSLNTLIKFDLIDLERNISKTDYGVKTPGKSSESRVLNAEWGPSDETIEIINMTDVSNEFLSLKLKEFKIYWIERGQKKNNWNITFFHRFFCNE